MFLLTKPCFGKQYNIRNSFFIFSLQSLGHFTIFFPKKQITGNFILYKNKSLMNLNKFNFVFINLKKSFWGLNNYLEFPIHTPLNLILYKNI